MVDGNSDAGALRQWYLALPAFPLLGVTVAGRPGGWRPAPHRNSAAERARRADRRRARHVVRLGGDRLHRGSVARAELGTLEGVRRGLGDPRRLAGGGVGARLVAVPGVRRAGCADDRGQPDRRRGARRRRRVGGDVDARWPRPQLGGHAPARRSGVARLDAARRARCDPGRVRLLHRWPVRALRGARGVGQLPTSRLLRILPGDAEQRGPGRGGHRCGVGDHRRRRRRRCSSCCSVSGWCWSR